MLSLPRRGGRLLCRLLFVAHRVQFSGWLSRARQDGVFQSDAGTWEKRAIGADGYGIPLGASSSETARLVPPLNF